MNRRNGTYVRFRISPSTIRSVANLGGKIIETGLGVNQIVSAVKLKKQAEKHARLANRLQVGKGLADVCLGIATAITNLFTHNG